MAAGGIAVADVDGDDQPDVFVAGANQSPRFFRQVSSLRFEDVTEAAGFAAITGWTVGATFADVDGDHDADLAITRYDQPNLLFINDGSGKFTEQGDARGMAQVDSSHSFTFADIDADGDLDAYLLTNRFYHPDGEVFDDITEINSDGGLQIRADFQRYFEFGKVWKDPLTGEGRYEFKPVGRRDYLLLNDGTGNFTDVTKNSGISGRGRGLSTIWADIDDDGDVDLYVANDFDDPDHLYLNQGDGTFVDAIGEWVASTPWFSMGSDAADFDGDGRIDLMLTDMSGTTHFKQKMGMGAMSDSADFLRTAEPRQYMRNHLMLNSGLGYFRDAAFITGLDSTDWTWAVKALDIDHDSRTDLFFTNGMSRNFNEPDDPRRSQKGKGITMWDRHSHGEKLEEQNLAFQNLGDLSFRDRSADWGLDLTGTSMACAHADLDGDGDLDLLVMNLDQPLTLYRHTGTPGHRVTLQLKGRDGNTAGLGAKVTVETKAGKQVKQLAPYTGYLSSNQPILHFGLGAEDVVSALTVRWPSGTISYDENLLGDHHYIIEEPAKSDQLPAEKPGAPTLLTTKEVPIPHVDRGLEEFDDFEMQPLLPNQMSRLGPGVAVADFTGDGLDDVIIGGALGAPSFGLASTGTGGFEPLQIPDTRATEVMGITALDADGDGDLDLYLATGSYEIPKGDSALRDLLWINDGSGGFSAAPSGALPDHRQSDGAVLAADFDQDGKTDLFVGARVVPGGYPESPKSILLRGVGDGTFEDVTPQVLRQPGMVTAAAIVGDDLYLTTEWEGLKRFTRGEGFAFTETTPEGLSRSTGWWNSLEVIDANGDGHADLVAGNFGLNTKYHVDAEHPVSLFYGDFESDGRPRIVEAAVKGDQLLPIRGRSCSTDAIPVLAERFASYREFASSTLVDIYPEDDLEESLQLEAVELRSGVFLSDGEGDFDFLPLPRAAQLAPTFGMIATELNGDGHPDLILAQNFFSPQPETGRMGGSLGCVLLGIGNGEFEALDPAVSGLRAPGDCKALVMADFNADALPDFMMTRNGGNLLAPQPSGLGGSSLLCVQTDPGVRLSLKAKGVPDQHQWVGAATGYLSRSASIAFFALPPSGGVLTVSGRDGQATEQFIAPGTRTVDLR